MRLLSRLDLHQRLSPRAYRLLPLDCTHKHNAEQCSRAAQNHITYQINNSNRSKEYKYKQEYCKILTLSCTLISAPFSARRVATLRLPVSQAR